MMFTGSKKELLDLIKRNGTLSIDEAVTHTDLAKTTLREHFLQLERDGYIQREYVRSGPGRPSLEYQMTQKGNSLYPSYESTLIKEMIRYLKKEHEEEIVERFFEVFWDKRLAEARRRMENVPEGSFEYQMEELQRMLEEEGFMADIEMDDDGRELVIRECNCPFSEVVKETQLPCKLEAAFYKELFNQQAERTSFIAEGDHSCTYEIPLNA